MQIHLGYIAFLCHFCDVTVAYSNMRNLLNQPISKIPFYFSLFWQQKDLDFTLKVIGGDLSALPGISDAIEVQSISCLWYFCHSFDFCYVSLPMVHYKTSDVSLVFKCLILLVVQ